MCLRYRSGSKGHGCKGVLADGNAQFDSYGTHGYTRPLSSSTDCADAVAARNRTNSMASANGIAYLLSHARSVVGGPPATERACDKSYAMPFALATLFVLFLAATASAQSVLDDKGRVYP